MSKNQLIPNGWHQAKLKELGVFSKGSGILKSQLSSSGNCAIRYGELYTRHHIQVKQIHSYISDEVAQTARKIEKGDILFAGSGETIDEIGKSAVYLKNDSCYAGGDIIVFSPKKVDSLFLAHLLNMGEARKKLRELGQGQAVVHLYKSDLEDLSVTIPPLPEQRRIVSILETWDKAIEALVREIDVRKQIRNGLINKMLSGVPRFSEMNEPWKVIRLGDLAKTSSGGTPKSTESSFYENGTIPWVNSGELRKGIISDFENYITQKGLDNSSAKLFPIDTVLIAMYGATAGQVGILKKQAATNQAICGIIPNEKFVPKFIYYFFGQKTEQLLMMGSGAAQPNISQEILKDYDILLPPISEQQRIVKVLDAWGGLIDELQKKLANLQSQKDYLLNTLMTGVIRTPEAVSVLTKQATI